MSGTPARGWRVVAGLAAIQCVLFGVTLNSFSVLLLPIGESFASTGEETARSVMVFVLALVPIALLRPRALAIPVRGSDERP